MKEWDQNPNENDSHLHLEFRNKKKRQTEVCPYEEILITTSFDKAINFFN
mgnify:CR=1 FL=1